MKQTFFKSRFFLSAAIVFVMMAFIQQTAEASVANTLINGSFEDDLGGAGGWDNTANRGLTTPTVSNAVDGSRVLRISENQLAGGEFGFTFQGAFDATEGQVVTLSGWAREVLDDGGEIPQLVIEFQGNFGTVQHAVGTASATFEFLSISRTAPAGTKRAVFVVRLQNATTGGGNAVGEFDAIQANITSFPVSLTASSSNETAAPGDLSMGLIRVNNMTADQLNDVELVAKPQPGINIGAGDAAADGQRINTGEGSVIFNIGSFSAGQEKDLTFPIILTSGVTPGQSYEIAMFARYSSSGAVLSPTFHLRIQAELDPVFEQGTIIGKVFNDANQNGVQDEGESGVPWVKLVTEEGIMVVTDEHGRYSIPGVKPGRHLVKVDGHSLPDKTKFITEENYLVKTTPGILNRANFAVLLPPSNIPKPFEENLSVRITQGLDTSRPTLDVSMEPHELYAGLGTLEKDAVFHFDLNYPEFVKNWYIEIRDEAGREIWTGFGVSEPPTEVSWSGQTESGLLVSPGLYSYQFKVEDREGREDWTTLKFFRVISKAEGDAGAKKMVEIPPIGNFNIFKDGKRSIPLVAKPTVRIQGRTQPGYKARINHREIPVNSSNGRFHTEFYVTPGEKEFLVESISPSGEVTAYKEVVDVKDSMFFMVALGEEELGYNLGGGSVETAGNEGRFKEGFYQDGRLSYFLKGKLKGKFLVKSHYDTEDNRSALFRNLDPDDYYPVYGDGSTIDYDAVNTGQKFYILIEMDRSFVKWGSYETAFNDTELSTYNRTLSGLKVHYESLNTTAYGDPKQSVKLFWAQARHRADHNEFAATGGSLYYLRERNVIEGSEKLRVVVRDKIQNIAISSRDLTEGQDYEIDYNDGRVLLSRPLSSVAASDTLISADILDGNPVYLVVDYEYDAGFSAIETGNKGIRGTMHMGDHVRIGATAVSEDRHGGVGTDYDMRGVDMQIKLGRNTKIVGEYAESKKQQTGQSVSYDGGLTFNDLSLLKGQNTRPRENAYLVKAESKPFEKMEVSGYVQGVEPGFSNENIRSQEGTKKYGVATKINITDNLYMRYRFDSSEVIGQLLPLEQHDVSAAFETRRTHLVQAVYDDGQWLGQAEYIRQNFNLPSSNLIPSLLSENEFENGIAVKLGYRLNEKLFPYAKFQSTFDGENNYQLGGGLRYQVADDIYAYFEEMVGNVGDSTLLGFEKFHDGSTRSYANIRMKDRGIGSKTLSTTVGSSFALTEKSRVFTEREHSTYNNTHGFADILGYEGKAGDRWDYEIRYERRHIDNEGSRALDAYAVNDVNRTNTFNTVSGALAYAYEDKLRARTQLELRRDSDSPKLWQWVTRNSLEYQVNQDLQFLGKLDFGKSRFTAPGDTVANFTEFNSGFAYRPVDHDKFNMLMRYTFLHNQPNDAQFLDSVELDERAHIIAIDMAYQVHKYLEMVEKVAYKLSRFSTPVTREMNLNSFLWVNRFNFHVTRKWDVAAEYRVLLQWDTAQTMKQGALVEVDREFYDYVRLGLGYNFTDFDDDLRNVNDYDAHGPFVRLTGKF